MLALPERLRADLEAVREATSAAELPSQVAAAFGVVAEDRPWSELGPRQRADAENRFHSLRKSLTDGGGSTAVPRRSIDSESSGSLGAVATATGSETPGTTPVAVPGGDEAGSAETGAGERIRHVVTVVAALVEDLAATGVLDFATLVEQRLGPDDRITVVNDSLRRTDGSQNTGRTVPVRQVLRREVFAETGFVAARLRADPITGPLEPFVRRWLRENVPATLQFDKTLTQQARRAARESVEEVYDQYAPDDVLVLPGQIIDEQTLELLRMEHAAAVAQIPWWQKLVRVGLSVTLLGVLAVMLGVYVTQSRPDLARSVPRLTIYLTATVAAVFAGRLLSSYLPRAEIIPVMMVAIVLAIAYDQTLATFTTFVIALVVALSTTLDIGTFLLLFGVSVAAVMPLRPEASRATLIKVGFLGAALYFVTAWGLGLLMESSPRDTLWYDSALIAPCATGAAWCLAASYLVTGSLPFLESAFGIVTGAKLLELSDVSHPLLQELARRAPGTYNHSITVATLAEAAADAIGANALLVRVGAYFHDIGKMIKPQYFIENVTDHSQSKHRQLNPAMSALIIMGHVKDGVELARQYKLPEPLIDFIREHHGTTLVEFFYREAAKQVSNDPDHQSDAEESRYRYPGPKPRSREAGIMMLADIVESVSRTLSDPTPKRIESLVRELVMKRLLDGQLDETSLTLTDLRKIEAALTKTLIGIYHGRIKYPSAD
ncbi:MAG: HDIG domain-containing protein [Planctomycetota bacterium]|nr:MAG: HDIG domain-containing protein [Planctomycetota bacterium]